MKPKMSDIRIQNRHLRERSFGLYVRLLTRLMATQAEQPYLHEFSAALRGRDFCKLVEAADSLSSRKYEDATSHFVANQFALLVKKYPFPKAVLDLSPRETAIRTFTRTEKRGERVNRKFRLLRQDPSRDRHDEEMEKASAFIRSVLITDPSYRSIFAMCDFGPGANIGVHGDATHILRKMNMKSMTVTPGAIHHAFAGIMHNFHFLSRFLPRKVIDGRLILCYDYVLAFDAYVKSMRVIEHNKVSFVRKTTKTDRSIGVEPLLNGFVQKGIDQYMRKRMKRIGIDLTDQSLNQKFARDGSINDDLSDPFVTLDLRNASNSLFTEVVRRLLTPSWFELLDRTRSKYYELNGVVKRYELFVSMGNGFCFPLETLIFASFCHAVGAGKPGIDYLVYGDDIIVRRSVSNQLIALLRNAGFQLNQDKSFVEGPFRESCGADWFRGEDVRPFTLDYELDSLESLFKFLNLSRRNERTSSFFLPIRDLLLKEIPERFRFWRPLTGLPDSGIDSTGDEHLSSPNCSYKNGCWEWYELVHRPIVDYESLSECDDDDLKTSVSLRGAAPIPHGVYVGQPEVTYRRKTRAKVARESYSSTSNWLPT